MRETSQGISKRGNTMKETKNRENPKRGNYFREEAREALGGERSDT